MGVEKGIRCNETTTTTSSSRCPKSACANIYRPPALRCQIYESKDSSMPPGGGGGATNTASVISSISCNNSPTHLNDSKKLTQTQTTEDAASSSDADVVSPSIEQNSQQQHLTTHTAVVSRRERRPDRAVYIPRARRSQTTPPATTPPQSLASTAMATESNMMVSSEHQLRNNSNASSSVAMPSPPKTDGGESRKKKSSSLMKKTKPLNATRERTPKNKQTPTKHLTTLERQQENNVAAEDENVAAAASNETKDRHAIGQGLANLGENNVNEEDIGIPQNFQGNCFRTVEQFNDVVVVEGMPKDDDSFAESNTTINVTLCTTTSTTTTHETENINSPVDERSCNDKYSNLRIEDIIATDRIREKCDIEQQELQKASREINRSNRRIIKQTFVSDILEIPETVNNIDCVENKSSVLQPASIIRTNIDITTTDEEEGEEEELEEDDWESMYDESGECLDPKLLQELTASVGKVKIELPKMDYSAYLTKQTILNSEEFPHVLEVSNFPVEFKNQDLLMLFAQYKGSGFDIKWVDDTHALAIFSSSQIATEVLTMGHPFVVLKPLAEATMESRLKAKKCAGSLQPYRPRPETCAALARRLVTGALGVKLKTAAAERENEKRVLREAKERKLLAAKQRDEIWES